MGYALSEKIDLVGTFNINFLRRGQVHVFYRAVDANLFRRFGNARRLHAVRIGYADIGVADKV